MTPLSLSLAVLLCLSVACADPIRVGRRGTLDSIGDYATAVGSLRNKFGYARLSNQKRLLGTDVTFSCGFNVDYNVWDYGCWTSHLMIGTGPPQRFDAYLSTMSGDLWVTSGNCTQCNTRTVFNKSKSDTFQAVQYSIGQPTRVTGLLYNLPINGDLVQDTVAIGLDPALQVQNQTWGLMDDINAVNLTGLSFRAGVMGFGFNSSTAVTPFWQSLLQANLLQAPEMGFWLRRRGVEPGGVLNLGGRDPSSFTGDVEFYQLVVQTDPTQPTYWRLNVSGVTVNKRSIPLPPSSTAIFSIGGMLIVGPAAGVKAIYARIPGSHPLNDTGFYGFPCNTTVEITMAFGGRSWPISTQHMNLGPVSTDSAICVGGILNKELRYAADDVWYVGAPFLRSVYTVFRFQPLSIGFANLSVGFGGNSGGAPRAGNGSGYTGEQPVLLNGSTTN